MTGVAEAVGLPPSAVADLIDRYTRLGWTIGTAESLTGGLLTAVLTEVPGSSAVVRGGLVVYATDLKAELAGVDNDLLAAHGPVHELVARQLAEGARARCGSTVGVGITGVAGPDPQHGVPVGTWYCALAGPGSLADTRAGRPRDTPAAHRGSIRAAAVGAAVEMLIRTAATTS